MILSRPNYAKNVVSGIRKIAGSRQKKPVVSERVYDQINGIQYLRGLAAVMVIFVHIGGTASIPKYFGPQLFGGLLWGGGTGVQLFFVISGFIIAYTSLSEKTFVRKLTAKRFLKKRFIRIMPFMWVCVIGHALLMLMGRGTGAFPVTPYLRSLFLFPIGELLPNVTWTLRHEFIFYLVFCLSMIWAERKQFLLLFWIFSPLAWRALLPFLPSHTDALELGNLLFSEHNLLFGIGLGISFLFLKRKPLYHWETKHGFIVCFFLSLGLFIAASYLSPLFGNNKLVYELIVGGMAGAMVVVAICLKSKAGLSRLNKIGLLVGHASYSIYLTHSAIISCIFGLWAKFQETPNPVLLACTTAFCCCISGIAVHLFVEKPMLKILQSKKL